jgi:rubrerythrin
MSTPFEDFAAYIEFFYNDEKKAVKEYKNFIKRLPDNEIKKCLIHILKDEQSHEVFFKSLMDKIEQKRGW